MAIHVSKEMAVFMFGVEVEKMIADLFKREGPGLVILEDLYQQATTFIDVMWQDTTSTRAEDRFEVGVATAHPLFLSALNYVGFVTVGRERYSDCPYLVCGIDANYAALLAECFEQQKKTVSNKL
jgi:hypothetical protein